MRRRARSNNSLTGSLPESYAALSQLQELWAVENNLTGSLPPSYSNLSNLAAVELWSNSLTGGLWGGIREPLAVPVLGWQ